MNTPSPEQAELLAAAFEALETAMNAGGPRMPRLLKAARAVQVATPTLPQTARSAAETARAGGEDVLQDLHNELYRAQITDSPDVLTDAVGKARLILSRYRAALSAPPAVPDTESTRARLEYAARSLRSIADKGRVGLGDSYPEIVALWATIRDIAAAPPVAAVAQPLTDDVLASMVKAAAGDVLEHGATAAMRGDYEFRMDCDALRKLLAALPVTGAAVAQPSQAYMCHETETSCRRCTTVCEATAPVVGVADEQIAALKAQFGVTSNGRGIREFTQVKDFALAVVALAASPAAVAQPVAPGWNEAVEAAAKVLDNGSFLHKDSPVKKWATEAAQAVRKLLRPLGAVERDGLPIDKPKSAAPYLSPREKRLRDAVRKMHQWREEKRAALTVAALVPIPYAEHEAEMLAVIDERDRYHDMADQLAAFIAAITGSEIGEHSSDNDPWSNALICANEWIALAASPIAPQAGQAGESGETQLVADEGTPGLWFVRKRERDGKLLDCFVAAPDFLGLPYDAEILGDDEYRDGKNADQDDGSGMRRKLADCELIVTAVNARRAALRAQAAPTAAPATQPLPRLDELLGVVRTAMAQAERVIKGDEAPGDLARTRADLPLTLQVIEHALKAAALQSVKPKDTP
jgi:hypothetical protein